MFYATLSTLYNYVVFVFCRSTSRETLNYVMKNDNSSLFKLVEKNLVREGFELITSLNQTGDTVVHQHKPRG